jgi:hypothetical protein
VSSVNSKSPVERIHEMWLHMALSGWLYDRILRTLGHVSTLPMREPLELFLLCTRERKLEARITHIAATSMQFYSAMALQDSGTHASCGMTIIKSQKTSLDDMAALPRYVYVLFQPYMCLNADTGSAERSASGIKKYRID